MKLVSRKLGKDDVILDEDFHGTLILESGDAFFFIREINSGRIAILCPDSTVGDTVYRMLIEPIAKNSFQVTEWVIPLDTGAEKLGIDTDGKKL